MIKLELTKWGETPESLLRRNLQASHPRVRERFLALSLIASGMPAIQVAQKLGRNRGTVEGWVHQFNARGPEGIIPGWKGRHHTLTVEELENVRRVVQHSPRNVGLGRGQWTGKVLAAYIRKAFGKRVHPRTALRYLHRLGFRRKRLVKADPKRQEAFARKLEEVEHT